MNILRWFKRAEKPDEVLWTPHWAFELGRQITVVTNKLDALQNTLDALLKSYKCIICGNEFARLPHQSDKRCPACQREIKQTAAPSVAQGNSGQRGAGHNTRGIHKKVGP